MASVTKRLAAAQADFQRRVIESIERLGAVKSNELYEFILTTPAGDLGISVWDCAVMCRFDDVEQGKAFTASIGCDHFFNRYSGKWNWHFCNDASTLNGGCESEFVHYIERLMKWQEGSSSFIWHRSI